MSDLFEAPLCVCVSLSLFISLVDPQKWAASSRDETVTVMISNVKKCQQGLASQPCHPPPPCHTSCLGLKGPQGHLQEDLCFFFLVLTLCVCAVMCVVFTHMCVYGDVCGVYTYVCVHSSMCP